MSFEILPFPNEIFVSGNTICKIVEFQRVIFSQFR